MKPIATLLLLACAPLGSSASGARRERMEQSPQWAGGHFENPQPLVNDWAMSIGAMFHASPDASPRVPPPTAVPDFTQAADGLRVTWFGHSATFVEIDGTRVLTDPMWSDRAGPVSFVGPTRWFPPLIALAELPTLDAVVISHDHYDHLDYGTVKQLNALGVTFIVGLGVGAHLEGWGVPLDHIRELDWWETTRVGSIDIVCLPARHASGRKLIDNDGTLWAGYAFIGARHRVYFSGDTGLFPAMKEIGAKYGPFDLSMIEVGQYHRAWPDWHIGPEQAVTAHQWVHGKVFLPIHWGLLELAPHAWTEPVERAWAAAQAASVTIITPQPGESITPATPRPPSRWWPETAWTRGEDDPIISTQLE